MEYPKVPSKGFLSGLFDATLRINAESRLTFSSTHKLPLECIQAYFSGPIHQAGIRYDLDLRHPLERCAICSQVQSKTHQDVIRDVLQRDMEMVSDVSVTDDRQTDGPVAYNLGVACGLGISKWDELKKARPLLVGEHMMPIDWSDHVRSFIEGGNLQERFAIMHRIYVANNKRHTVLTESHKYFLTNRALVQPLVLRIRKRDPLTFLPYRLVKDWCDATGVPYSTSFQGMSSFEREFMEGLFRKGLKPAKILKILYRAFPSLKQRLDIRSLRHRRRHFLHKKDVSTV